jgi:hypothetical protein
MLNTFEQNMEIEAFYKKMRRLKLGWADIKERWCWKDFEQEEISDANMEFSFFLKHVVLTMTYKELPEPEELVQWVDEMVETHFQHFNGALPHGANRYFLSNVCLLHNIKDPRVFKIQDDGSFLSPRQLATRKEREFPWTEDAIANVTNERFFNFAKKRSTKNPD